MNLEIVVRFDKLDQEYLDALCIRTGKNQQDVIKLALAMLHQQLCADAKQAPALQMPGPVYVYPVVNLPPPPGSHCWGYADQSWQCLYCRLSRRIRGTRRLKWKLETVFAH